MQPTGDWDKEATQALLRQMHQIKQENKGKKIVRIGYSGWEKITENLNMEGHKYSIQFIHLFILWLTDLFFLHHCIYRKGWVKATQSMCEHSV